MSGETRYLNEILKSAPLPAGLFDLVCQEITLAKLARARLRLVTFAVASVSSVVGLVMASSSVSTESVQSGFLQYLSLLFSDAVALSDFWMALAESLPILPLLILLGSFWLFLESVRYLFEDASILKHGLRFKV